MQYLNNIIEATNSFDNKEITIQEWVSRILGEEWCNIYSDEYCRRAEKFFSLFIKKLDKTSLEITDNDILKLVMQKEADLKREKEKIRQEKNQLAETYRWQARNELFQEKILDAINKLEPLNQINDSFILQNENDENKNDNVALLCISDFHAGSTYEVKGFNNEIINKYNFEIMEDRLHKLSYKIINDNKNYNKMVIAILGDAFENILRLSSLMKLREPVLDTVIKFSEFLSRWIVNLQLNLKIPIKVICVGGNHDVQRLLGEKPSLEEENLMKIVVEFLKLRTQLFDSIEIADYSDAIIENINGTSILFEHGIDKDLTTTINYFENFYHAQIDEIYSGHLHRPENKSVGLSVFGDKQINRVGSICGLDPFGKKCRVASRPSAYIAIYTDEGKDWNKTIYL